MLKSITITMVMAFSAQQAFALEVRCGTALRPYKYTIEDGADHATIVSDYIIEIPKSDPVTLPVYERTDNLVVLGNANPKIRAHIVLSPVPKMEIYSEGKLFQTDPCELIER